MNLLDRNFPDDLLDRCKAFSGKATGTDAVKETLYRLFERYEVARSEHLKMVRLERQLESLLDALQFQENSKVILESAIREARDPNAFYLDEAK